jgi:hypothetical protein
MPRPFAYTVSVAALVCAALLPTVAPAAPKISTSGTVPPSGPLPANISDYLAGWQITEPGISRASVSFVVPAMTCPTTDTQGTAVGLGNEAVSGAPTMLGVVFLACVAGAPYIVTDAKAGGAETSGTATTGDRITVIFTQTRKKATVVVQNVTAHTKTTASGPPTPDNTVLFGDFPLFSGVILPVADFGNVLMTKPTLENADLRDWGPTAINRSDGTNLQVDTTAFALASGAFRVRFRHN